MVQLRSWVIPGLAWEHSSPWRVPVEKQQQQYLIKVQAKETSWKSSICNQIGKMKNCLNEPSIDTVNPILAPKVHKLLLRTSQLTSADLRTWIQTFLSSRIHRLLFDVSERSAKNANTLISELQKSVPTNFYWGGGMSKIIFSKFTNTALHCDHQYIVEVLASLYF